MAQRVRCMGLMLNGVVGGGRWRSFLGAGETLTRNTVANFCTTRTQTQPPPPSTPPPPPNPSKCDTGPNPSQRDTAADTANANHGGVYHDMAADKLYRLWDTWSAVFPRLADRLSATDFGTLKDVPTELFYFTVAASLPMLFAGPTYVAIYVTAANTYHMINSVGDRDSAPITVVQLASNLAPTLLCASTVVFGTPALLSTLLMSYASIRLSDDILSSDRYPQWRNALVFSVLGVGLVGLTTCYIFK